MRLAFEELIAFTQSGLMKPKNAKTLVRVLG
jgi:hypothetical protein